MDVHAPHEPIHTWRDFAIHLVVITIGLLIALSLESLVEHIHQRHLLHTAETNLHVELQDNRDLLAGDERQLNRTEAELQNDIATLTSRKSNPSVATPLDLGWTWNGMEDSAWTTARDSGALTLMPYDAEQAWSVIYGQQGVVNDQARVYILDIYRAQAPLKGRTFAQLTPAELDQAIAGVQQALVDLDLLRDLCKSLDKIYLRNGHFSRQSSL
jgi:hypothetical protein